MLFRTAEERGELTMKNLNNRAKATIVMIMSFALVLSLMSCTSCDVKTEQSPVPEASAISSASAVSETSAVSEETESSEESVAISDSAATSESESTSASTARGATPTPKPTSTPKVTATPAPTATPGRTTAQTAAPTPTPVSAGTNSAAAATPTPVPTATPTPRPTATPTPRPTATPTPTPTKVSVYSTLRINWADQLLAEAAAKGIDINAERPVEHCTGIYTCDANGYYTAGSCIDSSDNDAAVTRLYAAADAAMAHFVADYGLTPYPYGYSEIDHVDTYLYD